MARGFSRSCPSNPCFRSESMAGGGEQGEGEKSGVKSAARDSLLCKLIRVFYKHVLMHQLTRVSVQGARVSCLNGPITNVTGNTCECQDVSDIGKLVRHLDPKCSSRRAPPWRKARVTAGCACKCSAGVIKHVRVCLLPLHCWQRWPQISLIWPQADKPNTWWVELGLR